MGITRTPHAFQAPCKPSILGSTGHALRAGVGHQRSAVELHILACLGEERERQAMGVASCLSGVLTIILVPHYARQ